MKWVCYGIPLEMYKDLIGTHFTALFFNYLFNLFIYLFVIFLKDMHLRFFCTLSFKFHG